MSFFTEMAELAAELLGPGSDFGELVRIERPRSTYDPETRKKVAQPPLVQILSGTLDSELVSRSSPGAMSARYDKELTAIPLPGGEAAGGFTPGVDDRVIDEAGTIYVVLETGHVVKQGVPIVWVCGCKAA